MAAAAAAAAAVTVVAAPTVVITERSVVAEAVSQGLNIGLSGRIPGSRNYNSRVLSKGSATGQYTNRCYGRDERGAHDEDGVGWESC